jgi:hypothetical protein
LAAPRTPPSHDALVEKLVADARPVRPLRAPRVRLAAWLVLALLVVLVSAAIMHVRPDLTEAIGTLSFLIGVATPFAAALMAAGLVLRLAVPGEEVDLREIGFAVLLSAASVLLVLLAPIAAPASLASFVGAGWRCLLSTLVMAGLPWAALLVALRRGAPVAPGPAGAFAGAASFLVAAAGMRIVCSTDEALHLLAWHAAPIVAGAGISALVGVAWLGRWGRP